MNKISQKNIRRTVCLSALLMFILCQLSVQVAFASTEDRMNLWLGFDIENSLKHNSKWHYDFFVQPRFANNQVLMEQMIIRPSIFYQKNENWSYWLGYDFNPIIPRDNSKIYYEQRIWPQIEYDKKINNRLILSSRSRYEIRSFNDSAQIATRFRQRFETTIIGNNALNISYDLFYEGFFKGKGADWVSNEWLEQNRYYFGLEIPTNHTTMLNIGYLNIFRPRAANNKIDNVISIGLSINLEKEQAGPVRII